MKHVITTVVLALVLGGSAFAGSAAMTAKDPVARSQVRSLRAQVSAMNTRVKRLEGDAACTQSVLGVAQYRGYRWTDGLNEYITTAIDATPSGSAPQVWLQAVAPTCVQGGSFRANRLLKPQSMPK